MSWVSRKRGNGNLRLKASEAESVCPRVFGTFYNPWSSQQGWGGGVREALADLSFLQSQFDALPFFQEVSDIVERQLHATAVLQEAVSATVSGEAYKGAASPKAGKEGGRDTGGGGWGGCGRRFG